MRDSGKEGALDPASALTLAGTVLDILSKLGGPIAKVVNRRLLRRKVRKVIAGVTLKFANEHGSAVGLFLGSDEAIAHELARLMGAGRPLAPKTLADQWAASGVDAVTAGRLAAEYVQTLHDELLSIEAFRPLFETGAAVATAEIAQQVEDDLRRRDEREAALAYSKAADEYVHAALERLGGDKIAARRSEYDAVSLIQNAELNQDWRIIEKFRDVRTAFGDLVQERYADFKDACDAGNEAAIDAALDVLQAGSREFQALVAARLT